MQPRFALVGVLCVLSTLLVRAPAAAQPLPANLARNIFLPIIRGPAAPPNPFGFDLRAYIGDQALEYVKAASPKWTRAGDVIWADIEPVRGGGYHWEALAAVEANVRRLRSEGIEPTLVVHRSPPWAQRVAGKFCSPPKPEYVGDFTKFMAALAARYSTGDAAVNYWEIWNEPDFAPSTQTDPGGFGCWVDTTLPYYGGAYYGNVLNKVYPAIKSANRKATVLGGAIYYDWPNDSISRTFLEGILSTGAGNSLDALSFHAYGVWGSNDLLVNKTLRLRSILSEYGLANKPLFATEIAATCGFNASCPAGFHQTQANYAARIYAEAAALGLQGAFWFTLAINDPGFQSSQLIDDKSGTLVPRPSYYAFLNSAKLLQGARYIGPPMKVLPPEQLNQVQVLTFRKNHSLYFDGPSILYVLWVPQVDFPQPYNLDVPPGALAVCTDHLDLNPNDPDPMQRPQIYQCSDTNKNGLITRAVNGFPQYVEVKQ
jgi:hypothetical protein